MLQVFFCNVALNSKQDAKVTKEQKAALKAGMAAIDKTGSKAMKSSNSEAVPKPKAKAKGKAKADPAPKMKAMTLTFTSCSFRLGNFEPYVISKLTK